MNSYSEAGSGLKKMFIAQIGAVICAVLAVIPYVGIVAAIGSLVFAILSIVGLYGAGKDIEGCKTAFTITIINIVISILTNLFSKNAVLALIFGIAGSVCSFLVVYFVCTSVGAALKESGAADVAAKGDSVWKINLVCYAASIVISILALIPVLSLIAGIVSIVVVVVSLVAGILYMIFLYKSYQTFGA